MNDRAVIQATIADAGHFSAEQRERIIASYPKHEREARVYGVPTFGSGRVFPVEQEFISVKSFEIPSHWAVLGGMDFGWDHPAAAVRIAWDRDTDCIYVTACHRAREQTVPHLAATLRGWGGGMKWAWPHDGFTHDKQSGKPLAVQFRESGLVMLPEKATFPDGSIGVEAGIAEMLERMETGRLKVFEHLNDWWEEFRLYHRKDGLIVKEGDDLMCATRYAVMMKRYAQPLVKKRKNTVGPYGGTPDGWMA